MVFVINQQLKWKLSKLLIIALNIDFNVLWFLTAATCPDDPIMTQHYIWENRNNAIKNFVLFSKLTKHIIKVNVFKVWVEWSISLHPSLQLYPHQEKLLNHFSHHIFPSFTLFWRGTQKPWHLLVNSLPNCKPAQSLAFIMVIKDAVNTFFVWPCPEHKYCH